MRTIRTGFFLFGATAVMGAIAACSASSVGVEDEGNLPEEDATPDTGKKDAGKDSAPNKPDATTNTDSGKPDVTTDAKPDNTVPDTGTDAPVDAPADAPSDAPVDAPTDAPLPPVGAPCTTANEIQTQSCGLCGTQSRVCKADGDAGLVWHPWGFCQNEVVGGCVPGTTVQEACGLCGTMTRLCQADCRYANQACTGQPVNACKPGDVEFKVGLSCDAGGRSRTCEQGCTWGNFGQCTEPVNNAVLIASPTVGAVVTSPEAAALRWEMKGAIKLLTGSDQPCPLTSNPSSSMRPFHYAEVKNPTNSLLRVSVWHDDLNFSTSSSDTVMAVYPGAIAPADSDDNARKQCMTGTKAMDSCPSELANFANSCDSPTATGYSAAGIYNVAIPANGSIMIFSQFWASSVTQGAFVLKVRTEP